MDRVAFSEPQPLRLVRCRECGLVYRNPVERARELTRIYAQQAPTAATISSLHDAQLPSARSEARRLSAAMNGTGAVLEVGSYVGAFLTAARDMGLQAHGLDVNAEVNALVRARGNTVHDGALITMDGEARFDAIAIWNTFDQVPDPRAILFAAARLLRPRGIIVLRIPNGAFYAGMRARLASRIPVVRAFARELLAQNNLLGFPYRWGFTAPALQRLLTECGFALEGLHGDVLVPTRDEYTRTWARAEEMFVKHSLRFWAARAGAAAPWLEVYARRA
jgi:2-polyprenyl-3-methyl-5-hydroxy-6-metoxy-1,4-benzoquinol methylase